MVAWDFLQKGNPEVMRSTPFFFKPLSLTHFGASFLLFSAWRSKTSLVSVLYSMLQLASKATDTSQSREKLKVQKRKREDDEEEKVGMATHSSDL
ncbi:hypothetical protein TNIN_193971 [Trichonephila inaurata madagascariensis]|uniref:Uncharacterized protein n=1 Tax=Trichonephila inaurata madagascariensis TaxID=2747483 RepID=A0A8X6X740_9ARAC|nr:hypothetical protein TNIN_193971 [Trichonephila inaurata madagascariensis]